MMNIAELKLKIIKELATTENEVILNSIMNILESNKKGEIKEYNLSRHFDSVSKRYDSTLKKLAQ